MVVKIIIPFLYNPGSAATNRILALAEEFSKLGIKVDLILGTTNEIQLPSLNGVNIHSCVSSHLLLNYNMARIVKRIYDNKSVVYLYGSSILSLFLPNSYNFFCEYTEVPFYGRKKTVVSWIKEKVKLHFTKNSKGIFVITNSLYQYYKEKGIQNIEILNMFVDSSRFDSVQPFKKEKYIAYCGTISEFKDGVDCLIKAFDIFCKSVPNYKLKIIGAFESQESENNLKKLVSSLVCRDRIEFTGRVSPLEMPGLLVNASILALARPNNEQARYGFPTKLGEYLSTGNPVVVTKVGELPLFLSDKINCIFSDSDSPLDFAEKLTWVEKNPDEALVIGNNGRELTKTVFSAKNEASKALKFMEKLI